MNPLPMADDRRPNTATIRDCVWYDWIIVSFSGGKDSLALLLQLIDADVDRDKILLWHQHVDGDPHRDASFMDWPCTANYCQQVAEHFGVRLMFQWRCGGFRREMLKDNDRIAAVGFETVHGSHDMAGGRNGKISTRRMFPQVTANLQQRWCSSALKIDAASIAMTNDRAFDRSKILFLTGERRQESAARSKYAEMEKHRKHTKLRHVDHWRSIIDWSEQQVWDIVRKHGIVPHPAYRLGWGRVSCLTCIFGQADQWASVRKIHPRLFEQIATYEVEFGKTIHRGKSVVQLADVGTPYKECDDVKLVSLALDKDYVEAIHTNEWVLPAGAFRHCGGPT